ncbi:threonine/homoserine efflux transporter RhtA [Microbacteriaceae bacterium MWH-Ta3]|nr:threonine/homoserine efflux transporter RhtA [Microbacteriaceae bacterium MWH-Ta3]
MTRRSPALGYVIGLSAALLFGANGVVIKLLMDGAGFTGFQITQYRVTGTAILMGIALAVVDRRGFRIARARWLPLALMGVVGVGMLQATYAFAVQILPVGIALLLEYTAVPAIAVIAFVFYKEDVKSRLWTAIVLVLVGLAIVAQIWASELEFVGVLWAFAAAASLTFYYVMGERQTSRLHPLAVGFWSMLVASIFWSFLSGWWTVDPAVFLDMIPVTGDVNGPQLPVWLPMLSNIVLGTFLSFTLSLTAIKYLKSTRAGIIATSEVLFAFLVAYLLLGESLNTVQLVGAALVLAGVVLAQTARTGRVVDADLVPPARME